MGSKSRERERRGRQSQFWDSSQRLNCSEYSWVSHERCQVAESVYSRPFLLPKTQWQSPKFVRFRNQLKTSPGENGNIQLVWNILRSLAVSYKYILGQGPIRRSLNCKFNYFSVIPSCNAWQKWDANLFHPEWWRIVLFTSTRSRLQLLPLCHAIYFRTYSRTFLMLCMVRTNFRHGSRCRMAHHFSHTRQNI